MMNSFLPLYHQYIGKTPANFEELQKSRSVYDVGVLPRNRLFYAGVQHSAEVKPKTSLLISVRITYSYTTLGGASADVSRGVHHA